MNFLLSNKQSNFPFVFFMFAPFRLAALKKNLLFVNKQWASERKSSREMLYTWQESNKHDQQKKNFPLMCWRILNISALCLICQIYTIFLLIRSSHKSMYARPINLSAPTNPSCQFHRIRSIMQIYFIRISTTCLSSISFPFFSLLKNIIINWKLINLF